MLRTLLSLFLIYSVIPLFGQQEYNISVNQYNLEDGLSHNQIRWLHKDNRGMMWVGTANGINRYDGKSFKLVADLNFYSLINRNILEDHEGDLWLLTNHPKLDLVFFNTRTERIRSFEEKFGEKVPFLKKSYADAIMLADSTIIIKTKTSDLISYSANKEFKKFQVDIDRIGSLRSIPGSTDFWLQSYAQDSTSGTFNFLKKQLDGTFKKQAVQNIRNVGDLLGISKDKEFLFWNREEQAPTYTILDSKGKQTIFPFPHWVASAYSPSVVYDEKLDRFLILHDGQLSIMPRGDTTNVYTSNTYKNLIEKQVNFELYEDEIFWIGAFRGLTEISVKSSPFKRTAFSDPDFHTPSDFKSVRLIEFYMQGLNMEWPISVKKNYSNYWTYYKDENDRIWLGGAYGIFYLDEHDKKHKPLITNNGLIKEPTSRVLYFYKDQEGILWACANNGLFQLDPEKGLTARYAEDDPDHFLPAKEMRHMYQDEAGIFWIGTFNGLLRWDKKNNQYRLFTTKDGLSNNHIMAVYEDDYGFIWMSSDNGIMQFEKNTERVKVYLPEDGVTHREFNRASHFQDSLGSLYFGSLNGITHFHPEDFVGFKNEQPDIPLLLMECVLFSDESKQQEDMLATFQKDGKIVMRPGDRYLKFQFALLDYSNPNSIQYVYNIDGDTWNAGKENTLNISGLPYGTHTLTVKGRAGNGLFSRKGLSIPIEVLKPFYLQWWFVIASAFVLLFVGFAIQKIRTKNLIQRQRELEDTVNERTKTIQGQAEELRQLDKAKSRFLANISHEFRTPLTLILNTLDQEAIHKVTKTNTVKKKLNFSESEVDVMGRNAQRLSQLIEQLLDLATLESGKMEVQETPGDFQFYIKELVQSFIPLTEKKKINLDFNSNIANTSLNFDRDKIDKIIYNLLSNAIKFTPETGSIKIKLTQDQSRTFIEVKDSGVGISKENQSRIFDRFYQVNHSEDFTHEGTGLGLALVKELVEVYHGSIQIESEIGQGTCFKIALPLTIDPELVNEKDLKQKNQPSSFDQEIKSTPVLKIGEDAVVSENQDRPILLVIEDNEDLLFHHQKTFAHQYKLVTAKDGNLGVEKAFEHIPDLIICDVMMPGKNGYEVCEQLKSDERTNHIPIILLTAKAGQNEKLNGLSVGANEYLTKPYSQNELALRMTNLMAQQKRYQKQFQTNGSESLPEIEIITPGQVFVEKVRTIIEEQINNYNFGVEDLGAALGMSRVNLFRKLKTITGVTPSNYIRTYRLEKARDLLLQSVGNASEVSYMVGFNKPSYFFKCFKNEFGMTVGQFLKTHVVEEKP